MPYGNRNNLQRNLSGRNFAMNMLEPSTIGTNEANVIADTYDASTGRTAAINKAVTNQEFKLSTMLSNAKAIVSPSNISGNANRGGERIINKSQPDMDVYPMKTVMFLDIQCITQMPILEIFDISIRPVFRYNNDTEFSPDWIHLYAGTDVPVSATPYKTYKTKQVKNDAVFTHPMPLLLHTKQHHNGLIDRFRVRTVFRVYVPYCWNATEIAYVPPYKHVGIRTTVVTKASGEGSGYSVFGYSNKFTDYDSAGNQSSALPDNFVLTQYFDLPLTSATQHRYFDIISDDEAIGNYPITVGGREYFLMDFFDPMFGSWSHWTGAGGQGWFGTDILGDPDNSPYTEAQHTAANAHWFCTGIRHHIAAYEVNPGYDAEICDAPPVIEEPPPEYEQQPIKFTATSVSASDDPAPSYG